MIPRFLGCGLGNGGQFTKTTYNIEEKEQAWHKQKAGNPGKDISYCSIVMAVPCCNLLTTEEADPDARTSFGFHHLPSEHPSQSRYSTQALRS